MKIHITLTLFFTAVCTWAFGQNVGVDVATPQQKLDVAGAIKIGSTTTGSAGSLRWNGTEFQFHDGTSWITLNANTDDQVLDVIQLNGTDLEISIENDGQATYAIDLSSFLDNTDAQQFDQVSINGSNQLLLSLSNDGQATHVLDLSGYLDNTDEQQFDIVQLSGTNLELSLQNDGVGTHVIDLSSLAVDTDDQTLDVAQLTGTNLELSIEDDGVATEVIDLSSFLDNTDNQTFDVANITSDELRLSLEDDAQPTVVLDLAPYKDNTDDQQFDVVQLTGNNLELSLEDDGQATHSIDLSGFADNTDDQTIDVLTLSGNTLNISLEDDGVANETLNLSQFMDNTDDQALNDFSVSGNILSLDIEDAGGIQTVNLAPYLDNTDNQEITQFNLSGNTLQITLEDDAGGQETVDLSGYLDNTDDQAVTTFSLSGTDLQLQVEDDAGGLQTVDLDPLRRLLLDADGDTKIEVEATADEDQIRFTTDGGEAMRINTTQQVGIGLSTGIENKLVVQGSNSDTRSVLGLRGGNAQNTFANGAQIAFGYDGDDAYQHFIHTRHNSAGGSTNNSIDFYVTDGTQYNTITTGSTHVMSLNSGNVGVGEVAPAQLLHVAGTGRFDDLAGGGLRNVTVDNNGDLVPGSTNIGDITAVTAGTGLTGGGTAASVTLNAVALNGLTTSANDIRLGGTLVQATTITQGANNMVFNLNSTGDFHVQDNGTNHFSVVDNGDSYFGSDVYFRDENTGGTILGRFIDSGDDGLLDIYRNGGVQHRIHGNGTTIFNEQSIDADFRIESNGESGMFFVDGGVDRIGIGTTTPAAWVHMYEDGLVANDGVTDMLRIEVNRNDHSTTPSGPAILFKDQDTNNQPNEARIKMMTVNDTDYGDNDEAASNFVFETTDAGVASDKMIITGRGNVGIGALNPTQQLHVNGNVRIQGVGSNGSNTRILTVDGNGNVRYRDAGSWTYAGAGDNLGNHTATTNLNMVDRNILDANDLEVNRLFDGDGSNQIQILDNLEFQDNNILQLGTGSDLQIYHNGSHHYFRDYQHGAGNYYFQGEDSGGTNEALMYLYTNGGAGYVRIYQNGGERLETTSTGVQINNNNTIRSQPSGDYGSIQVDGGGKGAYEGYSINGRYVLMNDDDNTIGLYNDLNNRWIWLYERNDRFDVYDPDYAANSVAWRFDNNQNVSYRDLNMTDDDIWDANYVETDNMRDADGGSQVEVYDDFEWNDYDVWDVGRLTVNTIYSEDDWGGVPRGDYTVFIEDAMRINPPNTGYDMYADWYANEPQFGPSFRNYGYLGKASNYWYYLYSNNIINVSQRSTKRNITPLDENKAIEKMLVDDIKDLRPSLYKYKHETDELEVGNENKYRPQYHLGFILDETPDYLQDNEFSGVDVYALASMSMVGVKHNMELIEEIREGKGVRKINDFGSSSMSGESVWVDFDPEFTAQLTQGEIPIVQITPNALGAEVAVTEKTSAGFRIEKIGTNPLSFDWTAFAKVMTPAESNQNIPQEVLNQLRVTPAARAKSALINDAHQRSIVEQQSMPDEPDINPDTGREGPDPISRPEDPEQDPKGMDAGTGGQGLNDESYPELDKDPDPNAPIKEAVESAPSEEEVTPQRK